MISFRQLTNAKPDNEQISLRGAASRRIARMTRQGAYSTDDPICHIGLLQ